MEAGSLAEQLSRLPEVERLTILQALTEAQAEELRWDWGFWGRPTQIAPAGDWRTWLNLGGRGAGKTRAGAEWIRSQACGSTPLSGGRSRWIALIAETAADARDVMIEGEAGLLAVHPPSWRPHYEPSKRRVTWPNGAQATLYNATEPDQLRGPQHDTAWLDELAKWRYVQETWDMLQFGMRLGDPRQIVTTTPRPIPLLRELLKDPRTVLSRDTTFANRLNLPISFLDQVRARYEGTRLGRQELGAEILDDMPGALWTRANLDENRKTEDQLPALKRVVIAIDPAAKKNEIPEEGAATGIVAVALGEDNRGYVLEDGTIRASPNGWARRAIALFDRFSADCIAAEINNGGEMVEATIRAVRPEVPFKSVAASRGKWVRAEPVAALYEQNRISHVGTFAELEDEMMLFGVNGMADGRSPDRVDALVWGLTELFPQMTKKSVVRGLRLPPGQPQFSDPLGAYRVR